MEQRTCFLQIHSTMWLASIFLPWLETVQAISYLVTIPEDPQVR
jgi:hypothetical protein